MTDASRRGRAAARILFVTAPAEYYASTIVRVRQFLPWYSRVNVATEEMVLMSAARERAYNRLIAGPARIDSHAIRTVVRAALAVWGRVDAACRALRLLSRARSFDAVYVQWVLPPAWLVRMLVRKRVRIIYDFDDAVYLASPGRADAIVRAAWRVVAGSHATLAYALARNPNSVLVPSAVAVDDFAAAPSRARADGPLRIGWIGSPVTVHYLTALITPLRQLQADGIAFTLVVAGTRDRADLLPDFGDVSLELVPSYTAEDLPGLVAGLDVGLMPLKDGPWERAKCGMKALVYMASGVPAVCSPVGEVAYIVEDGVTGLLAADADEWEAQLSRLAREASLRTRIGAAGRQVVTDRYSVAKCFELLRHHVLDPLLAARAP